MDDDILKGWKDISSFLGIAEKTARTYEKIYDLPVYQVGRYVSVAKSELVVWLKTKRRKYMKSNDK